MTSLGTASADPGEIATGRLHVGELRDGSDVGLPVAVVNGSETGKTLYCQAASDGDELNGVGVLRRLVSDLEPEALRGKIFIVGIVNFQAFQAAQHRNPLDDMKMNRTYPGTETGTTSERIAAATFEAATRADIVLDLHQGSTSRMMEETRVRCGSNHDLHEECLELAKVFNCGYVLDEKGPEGQLARVAPDEGIPTIDPELGGSVGFDEESIRVGVEGIDNLLKYYGFLDGEASLESQTRASTFEQYGAPAGGLITVEPDLGEHVDRDDVLFTVTDVFGSTKERVTADSAGIFWRQRRLPQVATGEYVCSVGIDIDSY